MEIALPCYPATLGGRRTHMRVGALVLAAAQPSGPVWQEASARAKQMVLGRWGREPVALLFAGDAVPA